MPARSITSRRCALAALALIAALCLPPRAAAHGDLHAVIESLTERIAANPEDCALYYSRAELYRLHQDWAEAKADFDRAEACDPTLPELPFGRARLAIDQGDHKIGRAMLDALLQARPTHVEAHRVRAALLIEQKLPVLAADDYTSVVQLLDPPSPDDYLICAETLVSAGAEYRPRALAMLDQGIARFGPLVTLQLAAVKIEEIDKNWDAAAARMQSVIEKAPRKDHHQARLARIWVSAGQPEKARAAYHEARASINRLKPRQRNAPPTRELEASINAALANLDAP